MVAVPKPASTVVLVDEQYNVFLTKRPVTMKFLGGFYVFPGGGMESSDREIADTHLTGEVEDESLTKGHYIAAARELFEEVGILLGETVHQTSAILNDSTQQSYRKQLLNGTLTFGQLLKREQLVFNFDCLQFFGQLVTPERFPIRFDTKFFLAKLPQGQIPKPNEHEIDEAFWISAEEGLRLNRNKEILLAPPTIVVLESIIDFKNGEALAIKDERVKRLTKNFSM